MYLYLGASVAVFKWKLNLHISMHHDQWPIAIVFLSNFHLWREAVNTALCNEVCQWLVVAIGWLFFLCVLPDFTNNKTNIVVISVKHPTILIPYFITQRNTCTNVILKDVCLLICTRSVGWKTKELIGKFSPQLRSARSYTSSKIY